MDTDRKEQVKATSEQEIQSALDYIAQDLEQAVYIYDADGLDKTSTDNPPGIKDQIPPLASAPGCTSRSSTPTCIPVLVFWKREFRQGVLPVPVTTEKNDTFVYSLVAYYLIKGNNANANWSDAARIGRFQIQNGVRYPANTINNNTPNYITDETPSDGFQLFNFTLPGITLKDRMNRWQKTNANYTDKTFTLVDFIDPTPNVLAANCPANTQVPSTLAGGFYACVDSSKTSAQVYIRGNALARINNSATCDQSVFCPTVSVQIKGRGL